MDEAAFADLYQRYAPAIFAHCRRLLLEPGAARDAVHEAFRRALDESAGALSGDGGLRALYRAATYVCLDRLRAGAEPVLATPLVNVDATVAAARQMLLGRLAALDDTTAAILILDQIDGMTPTEVAQTLQITSRTVFSRLKRLERRPGALGRP